MPRRILPFTCAALLLASGAWAQPILITNASVIDGTGAPARPAAVRIVDGKIDAFGPGLAPQGGDTVVDARGLTLAPGFIDTHSHHDGGLFDRRDALAAVSQGITTIVVGQDGGSRLPLASFFSRFASTPAAINVASYAGHGTLRRQIMGDDFRRVATDAEVARMKALLREQMDAGALGLSTGLEYDPGIFSARTAVLELAKVAGAAGGRYISHLRSEDRHFWDALDELLEIGRAGIPVQIGHMKLAMRRLWGQADKLVAKLEAARGSGVNVTADIYPWTMWQSTLTVLYPKRNFTDRKEIEFILKEVPAPDDLLLGSFSPNPSYAGKTVGQIAKLRGTDPATTLMALIAESQGPHDSESVVATGMDERDVVRLLRRVVRRQTAPTPTREGRIDTLVRDEMRRQQIPGVAVAVIRKGATTARGYGYANVEHHVPVTDETIFQSGSLGKMLTAAAVMLQVEDGKLALHDPLARFVPDVPESWQSITVRHLLGSPRGKAPRMKLGEVP